MNKTIAIDIGDVCLKRELNRPQEYFGLNPETELPLEIQVIIDKFERGRISREAWVAGMRRALPGNFTNDEICHGWNTLIGDDIPEMYEFVSEMVAAGFRFVFFSDTSELHFSHVSRNLGCVHLISGAILSYEVDAKKPEDGMFEAFEAKYGVPCCYLDDMPQNIAAGRQRGWFSIQFDNAEAMRRDFFAEFRI